MRQLGSVYAPLRHFSGTVSIVEWTSADAFPNLGPAVGVDTETELITATCSAPPLVVLGVFDAAHSVCYIVYWKDAPAFMRELCRRDIEQRYFNLGFDEQVLDNEDPDSPLLTAIDSGRVRDMQIRVHLHEIATTGYIRYNLNSLAGCTAHFEGFQLDKGDGTENSARLSFRRSNPDGTPYRLTDEQVRYLPFDCIATWCLGEAVRPVPTEEAHTKGMVVLAHITSNGVPVDRKVYAAMEGKLKSDRDRYRDELISYGFPDPDRDDSKEAADMKARLETAVNSLLEAGGLNRVAVQPQKVNIRLMLVYAYCHETFADEVDQCLSDMAVAISSLRRKSLTKQESDLWKRICEDHEIVAFDSSKRAVVMQALAAVFLESYTSQLRDGSARRRGFSFIAAMEAAGQFVDSHPHWMSPEVRVGPRKFFQQHVRNLLDSHPGLQLDTTEKSGEVRLTLKDMWRLQDLGISDPFLLSYTRFNHCVKYLSTYMNHDYVKDDGKVHARYVSILRTARTSCNSPNLQQLPSRDKEYELKLMYRAPEGMLLCSTDYSFVELCAFGQACYTRFGFSVMRDVINAGLDPHRWFAGVMNKIITPDLSGKDDAKWVTDLKAYLKAHVTDQQRQLAKFANFGLPGGMGGPAFYRHCREGGLSVTPEETDFMRNAWIETFREMKLHMQPEEIMSKASVRRFYGIPAEDGEDEPEEDGYSGRRYIARCVNGFVRNNASKAAACNCQFQALVAYGAKLAGWNLLYRGGMQDRLGVFVHDEYLYYLRPDELDSRVPEIEGLMLEGMHVALPDVKVGVETSVSTHWDKHAPAFADLKKDGSGRYIIEPPDTVRGIYEKSERENAKKENQKQQ